MLQWQVGEGQSFACYAELRQCTTSPGCLTMPTKTSRKICKQQLPSIIVISLFYVFWWGWLLSLFVIVQTIHSLLYCQTDMTSTHFPYKKDTKSPFNLQFGFTDDFRVTLAILLPLGVSTALTRLYISMIKQLPLTAREKRTPSIY